MRHHSIKLTVFIALAVSLASPWTLLQSVAWAGMLIKFSRNAPVAQAIMMTLDGQHPCELCRAIQAGKSAERQHSNEETPPIKELQLDLPPSAFALIPCPCPALPPGRVSCPEMRAEPPRPPPPRSISAPNV
jgi:hypothetical protein